MYHQLPTIGPVSSSQSRLNSNFLLATNPEIESLIIDPSRVITLNGSGFGLRWKDLGKTNYQAYLGDERIVQTKDDPIFANFFRPLVTHTARYDKNLLTNPFDLFSDSLAKQMALKFFYNQEHWFKYLQSCVNASLAAAEEHLEGLLTYESRRPGEYTNAIIYYEIVRDHLLDCLGIIQTSITENQENIEAVPTISPTTKRSILSIFDAVPNTTTANRLRNPNAYIALFNKAISIPLFITQNYNPFQSVKIAMGVNPNVSFTSPPFNRYMSLTKPRTKTVQDLSLPGNQKKELLTSDLLLLYRYPGEDLTYYFANLRNYTSEDLNTREDFMSFDVAFTYLESATTDRREAIYRTGLLEPPTEARSKTPLVYNSWINSEPRFDVTLFTDMLPSTLPIMGVSRSAVPGLKTKEYDLIIRQGNPFFQTIPDFRNYGPLAPMLANFFSTYPGEQVTFVEDATSREYFTLSRGLQLEVINSFDTVLKRIDSENEKIRDGIPPMVPLIAGNHLSNPINLNQGPDDITPVITAGELISGSTSNGSNGLGIATGLGTVALQPNRFDPAKIHSTGQGARITNKDEGFNTYRRGWNASFNEVDPYTYESTIDIEEEPWQYFFIQFGSPFGAHYYRQRLAWTFDTMIATPSVEKSPEGNYWFGQNFEYFSETGDPVVVQYNSWIWKLNQYRFSEQTAQIQRSYTIGFEDIFEDIETVSTYTSRRNLWYLFTGDELATQVNQPLPGTYFDPDGVSSSPGDTYFLWRPFYVEDLYEAFSSDGIWSLVETPLDVLDIQYASLFYRQQSGRVPNDYIIPSRYAGILYLGGSVMFGGPFQYEDVDMFKVKAPFHFRRISGFPGPELIDGKLSPMPSTPGYDPPIPEIFVMNSLNEVAQ